MTTEKVNLQKWMEHVTADTSDGALVDLIYPVGSIYMSVNNVSPETLFGGTWERIKGRFLLGTGQPDDNSNTAYGTNLTHNGTTKFNESLGTTGGESLHTLTSAQSGVPAHGHGFTQPSVSGGAHAHTGQRRNVFGSGSTAGFISGADTTSSGRSNAQVTIHATATSGSTGTHSHTVTGGAVSNNTAANASSAHNNMPPYLAVNIWKRTA